MGEQAPQQQEDSRTDPYDFRQIPLNTIKDPAKAEVMAYAEKPYRDTAHVIGNAAINEALKIADTRNSVNNHGADNNDIYTGSFLAAKQQDYAEALSIAQTEAVSAASLAGDLAGERYDRGIGVQNNIEHQGK